MLRSLVLSCSLLGFLANGAVMAMEEENTAKINKAIAKAKTYKEFKENMEELFGDEPQITANRIVYEHDWERFQEAIRAVPLNFRPLNNHQLEFSSIGSDNYVAVILKKK